MRSIIIATSLFFLGACNQPKVNYYSTGEIRETFLYADKNDTASFEYTSFYKNGKTSSQGNVVKGEKVGKWTEWYADGVVKWSGDFDSIYDFYRESYNYKFLLEHEVLKVNQATRCRVNIEGIYYEFIGMFTSNGTVMRLYDDDLYDFVITPDKKGEEIVGIFLPGNINIAKIKYIVE